MSKDVTGTNMVTLLKRIMGFLETGLGCVREHVRGRGGDEEGGDGKRYLLPNYRICLEIGYFHMSFRLACLHNTGILNSFPEQTTLGFSLNQYLS